MMPKPLPNCFDRNSFGEFGTVEALVGDMDATVVFKPVTYESLQNEEFMELARAAFPDLKELYDQQVAVKGRPATPTSPIESAA